MRRVQPNRSGIIAAFITLSALGCSGTIYVTDPGDVPCETSATCGTGKICNADFICVPSPGVCSEALPAGDCPINLICNAGICVPADGSGGGNTTDPWCDCTKDLGCDANVCTEITDSNACSEDRPGGLCPNAEVCAGGFCIPVDIENHCSPEKPSGVCEPGVSCDGGYCIPIDVRPCSDEAPKGLCPTAQSCLTDATGTRCETQECGDSALYGACPEDHRCIEGTCEQVACNEYHAPGGTCGETLFCSVVGECIDDNACRANDDCSAITYCSVSTSCLNFGDCTEDVDCEGQPHPFGQGFECVAGECEVRLTGCTTDTDCRPPTVPEPWYCSTGNNCLQAPVCDTAPDCDDADICSTAGSCITDGTCLDDADCPENAYCSAMPAPRLCVPNGQCAVAEDCAPGHKCDAGACIPDGELCDPSATYTGGTPADPCPSDDLFCCSTGAAADCCAEGTSKCSMAGSCIGIDECVTDDDCLSSHFACGENYTCEVITTCTKFSDCLAATDFCNAAGECVPGGSCASDADCPGGERCNMQSVCEADPTCDFEAGGTQGAARPNVLIVIDRSASMQLCGPGDPFSGTCGTPSDDCNCCEPGATCDVDSDCGKRCDGTCSNGVFTPCSKDSDCGSGTCENKTCGPTGASCTDASDCTATCSCDNFCEGTCSNDGSTCTGNAGCGGGTCDTKVCSLSGETCTDDTTCDGHCGDQGICPALRCDDASFTCDAAPFWCITPTPSCVAETTTSGVQTRWDQAVEAVQDLMAAQGDKVSFGVSIYPDPPAALGDGSPSEDCALSCNSFSCANRSSVIAGNIDVPVSEGSRATIETALSGAAPGGGTPTAPTLRAILADGNVAGLNAADRANAVLLVTDGEASGDTVTISVCEPACSDGIHNGDETDIDCGGLCGPCGVANKCNSKLDCDSGICPQGICRASGCIDGAKSGDETDIDCGGSCDPCPDTQACTDVAHCASGVCTALTCAAPTCADGVMNGDELGSDCGGTCGGTCADGESCGVPADCTNGVCQSGQCRPAHCDANGKDGDETDLNCGGSCAPCADSLVCASAADCTSATCSSGNVCVTLAKGSEACTVGSDCLSNVCRGCTGDACKVDSALDQLYALAPQVRTFVVGFAFTGVSENLNCHAAHGRTSDIQCPGSSPDDCASQTNACYFTAEDKTELSSAFDTIIDQVTTCSFAVTKTDFDINAIYTFLDSQRGPGRTLTRTFRGTDWIYSPATKEVQFIDSACEAIQSGDAEPVITFGKLCGEGG